MTVAAGRQEEGEEAAAAEEDGGGGGEGGGGGGAGGGGGGGEGGNRDVCGGEGEVAGHSSQLLLTVVGQSKLQESSLVARLVGLLSSAEKGRQKKFEDCEKAREVTVGVLRKMAEHMGQIQRVITRKEMEAVCPEVAREYEKQRQARKQRNRRKKLRDAEKVRKVEKQRRAPEEKRHVATGKATGSEGTRKAEEQWRVARRPSRSGLERHGVGGYERGWSPSGHWSERGAQMPPWVSGPCAPKD